jgi:hypothetical protein
MGGTLFGVDLARTVVVFGSAPVSPTHLQLTRLDGVGELDPLFGAEKAVQLLRLCEMTTRPVGTTGMHRRRKAFNIGPREALAAKSVSELFPSDAHLFVALSELSTVVFDGRAELLALGIGALDHRAKLLDSVFCSLGVSRTVMLGMGRPFRGEVLRVRDLRSRLRVTRLARSGSLPPTVASADEGAAGEQECGEDDGG